MKLNTLNKYATVSLLALSTALIGCTPPTADISIRLTPESARNVRSGQYCAADLKAAFAKAFTDFQRQRDAHNGYLVENVSIPMAGPETCKPLNNVSMPGQMPWSLTPAVYDGINKPIAQKTFAAVTAATAAATGGGTDSSSAVPGDPIEAANNTISIRLTGDDIVLAHRGMFCASDLSKAFDQAVVNYSAGGATVDLRLPQNPLQSCQISATSAQKLSL